MAFWASFWACVAGDTADAADISAAGGAGATPTAWPGVVAVAASVLRLCR